uniref:Major facilitator superfamily (MFS) profile domain-containing protein n=1 Tax=Acrobeloides nanus TaxID=290746 RepID=A0A914E8D4_9BILA
MILLEVFWAVDGFWKTSVLVWALWIIANFCYYGITLFTTVIYQNDDYCHANGTTSEITNNSSIGCRLLDKQDYVDLLATSLAEIPGLIVTVLIIEVIGRKYTMALELMDTSNNNIFTIDEAIEALGFGKFQIMLSLLTGFAWMADAMEMMILAFLSPSLHCEWNISKTQQALITTTVFSGILLSGTIWGKICDKFGRKIGLILASLMGSLMGVASAISPNFYIFLLFRGLVGVAISGVPQSFTLYSEFLPKSHRAKCMILIEVFWAVGTGFEAILALLIMNSWGWRWWLFFSSIPLFVFILLSNWLPESARYLMTSGKPKEALKTLQYVAYMNGRKLPDGKLVVEKDDSKQAKRSKISDLLTDGFWKTSVLVWALWIIASFSYYGITLFATVIYQNDGYCHANVTTSEITNTSSIECKLLGKEDYIDLLTNSLAEIPGLIVTVFIIEFIGRKYTMALEFGAFAICISILYFCLPRSLVTVFLFMCRALIAGAFQALYVYTPEVYPTTLRGIGLGTANAVARIGSIITPFVAQVVSDFSLLIPIIIYGGVSLVGALAAVLLPIETRGRPMMETHY